MTDVTQCLFCSGAGYTRAGQAGEGEGEMMKHDDELLAQANEDWVDHTDSPYERYLELKLTKREQALREIHRFLSQPGRVNAATKKVCLSLAGFALNGRTGQPDEVK